MAKNIQINTIDTLAESINKLAESVDNSEIRLREHVSNEMHGLAYMVYKMEERLIDRIDTLELRMDSTDSRLGGIEQKVGRVEARLDGIDTRTITLEEKVDCLHSDMDNRFDGVYEHLHRIEIRKSDKYTVV